MQLESEFTFPRKGSLRLTFFTRSDSEMNLFKSLKDELSKLPEDLDFSAAQIEDTYNSLGKVTNYIEALAIIAYGNFPADESCIDYFKNKLHDFLSNMKTTNEACVWALAISQALSAEAVKKIQFEALRIYIDNNKTNLKVIFREDVPLIKFFAYLTRMQQRTLDSYQRILNSLRPHLDKIYLTAVKNGVLQWHMAQTDIVVLREIINIFSPHIEKKEKIPQLLTYLVSIKPSFDTIAKRLRTSQTDDISLTCIEKEILPIISSDFTNINVIATEAIKIQLKQNLSKEEAESYGNDFLKIPVKTVEMLLLSQLNKSILRLLDCRKSASFEISQQALPDLTTAGCNYHQELEKTSCAPATVFPIAYRRENHDLIRILNDTIGTQTNHAALNLKPLPIPEKDNPSELSFFTFGIIVSVRNLLSFANHLIDYLDTFCYEDKKPNKINFENLFLNDQIFNDLQSLLHNGIFLSDNHQLWNSLQSLTSKKFKESFSSLEQHFSTIITAAYSNLNDDAIYNNTFVSYVLFLQFWRELTQQPNLLTKLKGHLTLTAEVTLKKQVLKVCSAVGVPPSDYTQVTIKCPATREEFDIAVKSWQEDKNNTENSRLFIFSPDEEKWHLQSQQNKKFIVRVLEPTHPFAEELDKIKKQPNEIENYDKTHLFYLMDMFCLLIDKPAHALDDALREDLLNKMESLYLLYAKLCTVTAEEAQSTLSVVTSSMTDRYKETWNKKSKDTLVRDEMTKYLAGYFDNTLNTVKENIKSKVKLRQSIEQENHDALKSLLHLAIAMQDKSRYKNIRKLLQKISSKIQSKEQQPDFDKIALTAAVNCNAISIFQDIIKKRKDLVNFQLESGLTLLGAAAKYGHTKMMTALLSEKGVEYNSGTNISCLELAVTQEHPGALRNLLLKYYKGENKKITAQGILGLKKVTKNKNILTILDQALNQTLAPKKSAFFGKSIQNTEVIQVLHKVLAGQEIINAVRFDKIPPQDLIGFVCNQITALDNSTRSEKYDSDILATILDKIADYLNKNQDKTYIEKLYDEISELSTQDADKYETFFSNELLKDFMVNVKAFRSEESSEESNLLDDSSDRSDSYTNV